MRTIHLIQILSVCISAVFCGLHPDGVSKVSREQDALGNYKFSYSISNAEGEQFRQEGTDQLGRVVGSYGLSHNDGTHRVVDYVADKDGFRAQIRSNEPGVANSDPADSPVFKSHPVHPLAVAASSQDDTNDAFGARLRTDASRVAYVDDEDDSVGRQRIPDYTAREGRQRNFDDYRPQNPVAYYPGEVNDPPRPLRPGVYRSSDLPQRPRYEPPVPTVATRAPDAYYPPINPHTAIRRPGYYDPRSTDNSIYPSTTSRRPFTPPYGGFDDDPFPNGRRPGISMTTIHGGLGSDHFDSPETSTPSYGAGRYPSGNSPRRRDSPPGRYPYRLDFPSNSRYPDGLLAPPSRSEYPGSFFGPPSYDGRIGPPKLVLRAVPIPNGIQAVRVDANTGQVYERLLYPLYLKPDGYPDNDKRILLHNDDISDDDAFRNDSPGYFDIPFPRRPSLRYTRDQPFGGDVDIGEKPREYNRSYAIDSSSLSKPTAKELQWIQEQIARIEGFTRNRYPSRPFPNRIPVDNSNFPEFDDFDESVNDPQTRNTDPPNSREGSPSAFYRQDQSFHRDPRQSDSLTSSDSNQNEKIEKSETKPQGTVIETKLSNVEKE